jgi:hypothetical protein
MNFWVKTKSQVVRGWAVWSLVLGGWVLMVAGGWLSAGGGREREDGGGENFWGMKNVQKENETNTIKKKGKKNLMCHSASGCRHLSVGSWV